MINWQVISWISIKAKRNSKLKGKYLSIYLKNISVMPGVKFLLDSPRLPVTSSKMGILPIDRKLKRKKF